VKNLVKIDNLTLLNKIVDYSVNIHPLLFIFCLSSDYFFNPTQVNKNPQMLHPTKRSPNPNQRKSPNPHAPTTNLPNKTSKASKSETSPEDRSAVHLPVQKRISIHYFHMQATNNPCQNGILR